MPFATLNGRMAKSWDNQPAASKRLRDLALAALATVILSFSATAQTEVPASVFEEVVGHFQRNELTQAEAVLRPALEKHPGDARALGLMAILLDSQRRYSEAEAYYQRALKLAPRSASLLNNYGNHHLARGNAEAAAKAFTAVLTVEPGHPNANLQLARLAVARQDGKRALAHLDRLPAEELKAPPLQLLRAKALGLAERREEAKALLAALEGQAGSDPRTNFALGLAHAELREYGEAERAFTRALESDPRNFDILYNLGLAAFRSGNLGRAKEVFETALRLRPEDADALEGLARVYAEMGQEDQAIVLLVRANRAAPDRADILMFLAHMTDQLGFYADTAQAYTKYLELRPHDDAARRERGFALARFGSIQEGFKDLEWYVEKHPKDAVGHYELGIAETLRDRAKAEEHFSRALELDPSLHSARYALAVLAYQGGQLEDAVRLSEEVLRHNPDDARALDVLGQALVRLNRAEEGAKSLARAVELLPRDPRIMMHYARALQRAGRRDEAEAVLARFRALGPDETRRRPYGGLIDFLNLPESEQRAQYHTNLLRQINTNPRDAGLKVRLGKFLFSEGKPEEALEAFREARMLTEDPAVLSDAARALMNQGQYAAAKEFLQALLEKTPDLREVRLDHAIVVFHTEGPEAGLRELDRMPAEHRDGDYFLVRAQMLDAQEKVEEAIAALNRGLAAAPTRPDLYFNAALFLIKHKRYDLAADLLQHANRVLPNTPELMLTQAISYQLLGKVEEAERVLKQIQSRWPEWSEPYIIHGIMLETRLRSAEARPLLETAVGLGAHDATAYYYLALAITRVEPDNPDAAWSVISQALRLDPENAYIRALAGKIAYQRKEYAVALEHLNAALELWPEMIEARQTRAGTYRALGEREKANAELQEVLRIKQKTRDADQAPPFPVREMLFTVRPPARPAP
jgi:tetratricopeptide (TPR) repeat protein